MQSLFVMSEAKISCGSFLGKTLKEEGMDVIKKSVLGG